MPKKKFWFKLNGDEGAREIFDRLKTPKKIWSNILVWGGGWVVWDPPGPPVAPSC